MDKTTKDLANTIFGNMYEKGAAQLLLYIIGVVVEQRNNHISFYQRSISDAEETIKNDNLELIEFVEQFKNELLSKDKANG